MEFFILIGVAIISFMWGWNSREFIAIRKTSRLLEELAEEHQQEQKENLFKITLEKHDGILFAYALEDGQFIAQGNSREELEKRLAERLPGKRFGCTEENLKEVGFLS